MGNICSCYIKTEEEEIIKDPKVLAQIRNKEFQEYQKSQAPKPHIKLYRLNAERQLQNSNQQQQ